MRFWVYVTTVPLTLLTLANLAVAWRAPAFLRGWWLAASGRLPLDRLISHRFPLADFRRGAQMALDSRVMKAVFFP